jgi:carboxylesterase
MRLQDRGGFHQGGSTGFLLLHGLSGTPVELHYVANGLMRAGHTVACPQLAGHCGTLEELRRSTWQDWAGSAETALAQLAGRCEHVFVGGLSMGAVLALLLAARNPQAVTGSLLLAPTLWCDGWGVPWYARLFRLVQHKPLADLIQFCERPPYGVKDRRLRSIIADAIHSGDPSKAGFLSIPGGCMLELRWLVGAVCRELGRIRQPVLILHPRHDDRASLRNSSFLEQHLSGRVEKIVLEDSYHLITLDRQREVVLNRILRFAQAVLAEVAGARKPVAAA